MRPEKLMIGDWLSLFQGNPDGSSCNVQVSYIGEYGEVGIEGCEEYTSANCNLLFPIPLTPEILEKIGFRFEQQGSLEVAILKIKNHHPITLEYIGWSDGRWSMREHRLVVKYVHELQHALRLCGAEKEIKL